MNENICIYIYIYIKEKSEGSSTGPWASPHVTVTEAKQGVQLNVEPVIPVLLHRNWWPHPIDQISVVPAEWPMTAHPVVPRYRFKHTLYNFNVVMLFLFLLCIMKVWFLLLFVCMSSSITVVLKCSMHDTYQRILDI